MGRRPIVESPLPRRHRFAAAWCWRPRGCDGQLHAFASIPVVPGREQHRKGVWEGPDRPPSCSSQAAERRRLSGLPLCSLRRRVTLERCRSRLRFLLGQAWDISPHNTNLFIQFPASNFFFFSFYPLHFTLKYGYKQIIKNVQNQKHVKSYKDSSFIQPLALVVEFSYRFFKISKSIPN